MQVLTTAPSPLPTGQLLRGTGPWRWGALARLYLFGRGLAYVPGTTPSELGTLGTWEATGEQQATLTLCGKTYEIASDCL